MLTHTITPFVYAAAIVLQQAAAPQPFHVREAMHEIRIELTKTQWDAMQPERSGGMDSEYPEERAKVTIDGRELDVAIRFKGNASYRSSQGSLKRPFKIDVNTTQIYACPTNLIDDNRIPNAIFLNGRFF